MRPPWSVGKLSEAISKLENCLREANDWMQQNYS